MMKRRKRKQRGGFLPGVGAILGMLGMRGGSMRWRNSLPQRQYYRQRGGMLYRGGIGKKFIKGVGRLADWGTQLNFLAKNKRRMNDKEHKKHKKDVRQLGL